MLDRSLANMAGVGSWRPDSAEVDAHVAARARTALDTPDARFVGDIARYDDAAGGSCGGVRVVWSSLGDLIEGSASLDGIGALQGESGSQGKRDITFYKSAGVAAQDVGTAEAVYACALSSGVGTVLELD